MPPTLPSTDTPLALPLRSSRRWRPSLALRASATLHAAGALACVVAPAAWPWVLGALVANHALLAGAGLVPRSRLLGANINRLPDSAARRGEVALTFDDGPDPEVTPRVLDALDARAMKATFFVVGERALRHPALVAEIVGRGHAVENHSHRHSTAFGWYGLRRLQRELAAAQAAIGVAAGMAPVFFRAPFGVRNPLLDPVLARFGLRYVSWTRRAFDTVARDPVRVATKLARGLAAGDILLLHDGVATGATRREGLPAIDAIASLATHLEALGLRSVTLRTACGEVGASDAE